MNNRINDADIRKIALNPAESFAIAAPAGSGKTELLTQRVLSLLAKANKPEEILCITFTRKAAAEMQSRIIKALHMAKSAIPPENPAKMATWNLATKVLQRDNEKQWLLLNSPHRLHIQTIDGFCARIAKHLPLLTELGPHPTITNNPDIYYQQAALNCLRQLEQNNILADDISILLQHLNNDINKIINLLTSLLAKRDQWLPHIVFSHNTVGARRYLEKTLQSLINEKLMHCYNLFSPLTDELLELTSYAAINLVNEEKDHPLIHWANLTQLPAPTFANQYLWGALVNLILTKQCSWRKRPDKTIGFPAGTNKTDKTIAATYKESYNNFIAKLKENNTILNSLISISELPPAHYQDQQWQLLASLTHILPSLAAQLTTVFREAGIVDYSEITNAAFRALGNEDKPTDLSLLLDHQIKHILIDEFQDTSATQMRLLQQLTYHWQPNDDRTIFIVGDAMQSCYGFRNANVGLFLSARQFGIGQINLNALNLSTNFRSFDTIINWINQTFSQAFPQHENITQGAVKYTSSNAYNTDINNESTIQSYGFIDDNNRHNESAKIIALIQQAQTQYPEDNIAILIRSRTHLQDIIPALRQANITWYANDIDPLHDKVIIMDLLTLTKALLNLADRIAWLALLRSPCCGLDLQDIHHIANYESVHQTLWSRMNTDSVIEKLSTSGQKRIHRLLDVIQPSLLHRQRKALSDWIQGIWLSLGGPAVAAAKELEYGTYFFQLMNKYEQHGGELNLQEFEQALEQQYANQDATLSNCKLHILTMHKAKGLEFDTVIIPCLDKYIRPTNHQLILWQEHVHGKNQIDLLLSPISPHGKQSDSLYQYLSREQSAKSSLESIRLLYVAATRAKKRLYMTTQLIQDTETKEIKTPDSRSLLSTIWKSLYQEIIICNNNHSSVKNTENIHRESTKIKRLADDWQLPALPKELILSDYAKNDDRKNTNPLIIVWDNLAATVGTIIHRTLHQMTIDGLAQWTHEYIHTMHNFWRLQLQQAGITDQLISQGISRIDQAINNVINDELSQWLLDDSHIDSHAEIPVCVHINDEFYEYIIDRTFVDNNIRWIIDYKTSTPSHDDSFEDFLQQEISKHQAQLAKYAKAYALMENRPIKTALYFPLAQKLCEAIIK